jgi:hypothetical protein
MPVRIKGSDGAWHTAASGGLRIKAGGAWQTASFCRIRSGGVWRDSGYVGYPNAPQVVEHDYWDQYQFTESRWRFQAPAAGGAPVSYYRAVLTDQNGNWLQTDNMYPANGSGPRWWVDGYGRYVKQFIGLVEDTRYRFFVQSVTAAGLESGWVEGPRIQMGHVEQGTTQSESYTQAWNSGAVAVNLYNGGASGPQVPNNVAVWGMYVNLSQAGLCGGQTWANLSPGTSTTRNIHFVKANAIDPAVITLGNPSHGWLYVSGNGGNAGWGLVGEGAGYAAGPATSLCRVVGDLTVYGDQTLFHDVYHKTRDYLAPSYW